MSNSINDKILNIFINIYELKTSNYVDMGRKNLNIIFDEEHITDKMLHKFFSAANDYKSTILNNFLSYALHYQIEEIIELFNKYKTEINNFNSLPVQVLRELMYICIKFILLEKKNLIKTQDILKFREDFPILYNYIENNTFSYTINDLYRKIIFDIASEEKRPLVSEMLKKILYTNEYDELIKIYSYNCISTEEDLKKYKYIFIRLLICDNYIFESYKKKQAVENIPEHALPFKIPKELRDSCSTTPLLMHIEECMSNNKYDLPNDTFLIERMLDNFTTYKIKNNDSDIDSIKKQHTKQLKKIYPMYILDI